MAEKYGVSAAQRHQMIAEAAYFLAEKRGFVAGDRLADWTEAEGKVDRRLCELATARVLERLESGLAAATKKLGTLKRRASALAAGARTEVQADVERLGALKETLRGKIEALGERGEQASQKALHQAEKVWDELSEAMQRIAAKTQH